MTLTRLWPHRATAAALVVLTAFGVALCGVAGASALLPDVLSRSGQHRGITAADGYVGDRVVTVYDVREPAIAHLDPRLRSALHRATGDAAHDGFQLRVNSGWRSRAYQRWLLSQAVAKYGSRREARRWVNTPEASTHVSGEAVDVGPITAARWLDAHGPAYGLCRVYADEPWHFELRTRPGGTCPALRADASR